MADLSLWLVKVWSGTLRSQLLFVFNNGTFSREVELLLITNLQEKSLFAVTLLLKRRDSIAQSFKLVIICRLTDVRPIGVFLAAPRPVGQLGVT